MGRWNFPVSPEDTDLGPSPNFQASGLKCTLSKCCLSPSVEKIRGAVSPEAHPVHIQIACSSPDWLCSFKTCFRNTSKLCSLAPQPSKQHSYIGYLFNEGCGVALGTATSTLLATEGIALSLFFAPGGRPGRRLVGREDGNVGFWGVGAMGLGGVEDESALTV